MDKIVINLETDRRECIACGFNEARPEATPQAAQKELQTRVNRGSARMVETPAEVVTLIDPSAPSKASDREH